MNVLYIDCAMGVTGGMLTAALMELLPDTKGFINTLASCIPTDVTIIPEKVFQYGIRGTRVNWNAHENEYNRTQSPHSDITHIAHKVEQMTFSGKVKSDILDVCHHIAEAEMSACSIPMADVHFRELGTSDALMDIIAVCVLMEILAPNEVVVSPVCVGCGQVHYACGIMPVPSPVTAHLLRNVPIYGSSTCVESCTPVAAALLTHFANRFDILPAMATHTVGYGMGKGDLGMPNCVRAFLGEVPVDADALLELACNVDDMTGEQIGFAMERLFVAGALDVSTTSISMKHSRPGTKISVLCREVDREKLLAAIFKHTSTIGVREIKMRRHMLSYRMAEVQTSYGTIRHKIASGYGVERSKYEYRDLAHIAREQALSLTEVSKLIEKK